MGAVKSQRRVPADPLSPLSPPSSGAVPGPGRSRELSNFEHALPIVTLDTVTVIEIATANAVAGRAGSALAEDGMRWMALEVLAFEHVLVGAVAHLDLAVRELPLLGLLRLTGSVLHRGVRQHGSQLHLSR